MKAIYYNDEKKQYETIELSDYSTTNPEQKKKVCASCGRRLTGEHKTYPSLILKHGITRQDFRVCRWCHISENQQCDAVTMNYSLLNGGG